MHYWLNAIEKDDLLLLIVRSLLLLSLRELMLFIDISSLIMHNNDALSKVQSRMKQKRVNLVS